MQRYPEKNREHDPNKGPGGSLFDGHNVGAILSQEAKVNGERNDEEDPKTESEWREEFVAGHGALNR
jgi:hypothetical protein